MNFVNEMSGSLDSKRQKRFKKNSDFMKSGFKLQFPDYNRYPYHVREVFEYFSAVIHKEDLVQFSRGTLFKDNIINVYLKILEKMHLVLHSQQQFLNQT